MEHNIYDILDTSWIMNPYHVFYPKEVPPFFKAKNIILASVKKEILKHLESSDFEKAQLARKARSRIADFSYNIEYYLEIDESSIPKVNLKENVIGPDSYVDRLIVAAAVKLAEENDRNIVYVSTHDGGIHTELARWRYDGYRIFSRSSLLDFKFTLLKEWDGVDKEIAKVVVGIGDKKIGNYSFEIPRVLTASEAFRILEAENRLFRVLDSPF